MEAGKVFFGFFRPGNYHDDFGASLGRRRRSLGKKAYADSSDTGRGHFDYLNGICSKCRTIATYGLNASITAAGRSVAPLLGEKIAMWYGMRSVFVVAAAVYGLAAMVVLYIRRTEYTPMLHKHYDKMS